MKGAGSWNAASLPIAFRDAALTVATLAQKAGVTSFDELRQRCLEQTERLREELRANGEPADVVQDAVYAQCALLDEAALSHLVDRHRDDWERSPLQVNQFGTHDAGEALIARMKHRLQEPQPAWRVLAIFHAVLTLGFHGGFASEGSHARAAMTRALADRLGIPEQPVTEVIVQAGRRRPRRAPWSLPVCVLLSAAAAVAVWVLLDRWLDAATARLLQ